MTGARDQHDGRDASWEKAGDKGGVDEPRSARNLARPAGGNGEYGGVLRPFRVLMAAPLVQGWETRPPIGRELGPTTCRMDCLANFDFTEVEEGMNLGMELANEFWW